MPRGYSYFIPLLIRTGLSRIARDNRLPGSNMIPAEHAVRTFLGLKLIGKERSSHVMDMVFDPGIALFAGLNTVPKRSFLSGYSNRVDPRANMKLMSLWAEALQSVGFKPGTSFDLDFHSIPANTLRRAVGKTLSNQPQSFPKSGADIPGQRRPRKPSLLRKCRGPQSAKR